MIPENTLSALETIWERTNHKPHKTVGLRRVRKCFLNKRVPLRP